jgi:Asp-tRNA(Asn)/Glu-tRNA(Gln) amidotransferase A subunit family amidase
MNREALAPGVTETAELVRSGEASAVEILTLAHERWSALDESLNSFAHVDWDRAHAAAAAVDALRDRGEDPGVLAGVPFGVKDLQDCEGMPTTCGSLLLVDAPPAARDSPSVARLRRAGAIPVGKTATAEWGMDSATTTRAFGTTRNPWRLELTPGGSSGGSAAAVSAGIVPFATGTDEGGSIRSPAAFCGLVGLKPTHGLVPRDDGTSDANVAGVLARTATDTALLLDVISGGDARDKMSMTSAAGRRDLVVAGLRATWSDDLGYAVVEPEVASVARSAAERLAVEAELDVDDRVLSFDDPAHVWMPILATRFLRRLQALDLWPAGADRMNGPTTEFIDYATEIDGAALGRAEQMRIALEHQVRDAFERTDLLLTPTVACEPFAAEGPVPTKIAGRDVALGGAEPFTMLANLTWLPAISIFAGCTARGLPVGLHITARWGWDAALLRLAQIWEERIHPPPRPTAARG